MKKIALLSLILTTVSPILAENLPPLPPPNEEQYRQVLQQIDEYCHSQPPAEESRLYCFLEQVHLRKEQGQLEQGLFERLLREGQMRLAWRKGFQEGLNQCKPGPLPPKPPAPKEPKPEPSASPVPSPKPTGTAKPKNEEPKNERVLICHKPSGDEEKAKTLRVASSAVSAHLAHGDSLGECPKSKDGSSKDGQGNDKEKKDKENGQGKEKEKRK